MSYNKCIMVGRLTKPVDLRYTASGAAVANMRIAVSSKYKSGDEYKEETLFIDVTIWGAQAESCSKYLDKGREVLVDGRLQERSWESDGQTRKKIELVAQTVRFLGSKGDSGGDTPSEVSEIQPF